MNPAKILIVDDHPLVRAGLVARISTQPGLEVSGEAADVDEALRLLEETQPDLMIVDLTLKQGHGLDLIAKASQSSQSTRMLVLSAHEEALFAERALRCGAAGYVNKQEAQEKVLDAIAAVLRGERFVSADLTRQLVGKAISGNATRSGIDSLSDRELQVFELIGRGASTRSIAEQLHLSVHTVETHRENIRAKLYIRTGSELVRSAVHWVLESRSGW